MSIGVIVASDEKSEWLLPWWWAAYAKHNHLPVCFVDLGLSHFGRLFCEQRGVLHTLEVEFSALNEELSKKKVAHWEAIYGKELWQMRPAWFKKPQAMSQTPFEKTLWLDLDCEVLAPLDSLFQSYERDLFVLALETEGAHLAEEAKGELLPGEKLYNSGVILYDKKSALLETWKKEALLRNLEFWGDQQLLSRIIYEQQLSPTILQERYNWRMARGLNLHAVIIHWVGLWGKEYIRKHGGLSKDLEELPQIF